MKMLLSDEEVDELLHVAEYDPVKAHEYYMRKRKLVGRKVGIADDLHGGVSRRSSGSAKTGRRHNSDAKTADNRKKAADARVNALKGRLEKLKAVLATLVKQAKARSGVEDKSKAHPDSAKKTSEPKGGTKGSDSAKESLTAKQKSDAAKRSKEYYDKNKKASGSDKQKVDDLNAEIKAVQEQIKKARSELKTALQKAREKSDRLNHKTAVKGR
jgi:hypothetical protein